MIFNKVPVILSSGNPASFSAIVDSLGELTPLKFSGNPPNSKPIYTTDLITCSGKYVPIGGFKYYETEAVLVAFDSANPKIGIKILDLSSILPTIQDRENLSNIIIQLLSGKQADFSTLGSPLTPASKRELSLDAFYSDINPAVIAAADGSKRTKFFNEGDSPSQKIERLFNDKSSIIYSWINGGFGFTISSDDSSSLTEKFNISISYIPSGQDIKDIASASSETPIKEFEPTNIQKVSAAGVLSHLPVGVDSLSVNESLSLVIHDSLNSDPKIQSTEKPLISRVTSVKDTLSNKTNKLVTLQAVDRAWDGSSEELSTSLATVPNTSELSTIKPLADSTIPVVQDDVDIMRYYDTITKTLIRHARITK